MAATLSVLPDSARVEERLLSLARANGFVAGQPACTLAELERGLIRAGAAAHPGLSIAPPLALRLALRDTARKLGPALGPFAAIGAEPAFARALEGLLAALAQGLCDPEELFAAAADLPPPVRDRTRALSGALIEARTVLRGRGLVDPHRALWTAVESLERAAPLPPSVADFDELVFEQILDWTPLRRRLALALAARLSSRPGGGRVRVRLPWSPDRPELTEALEPTLRAFESLGVSTLPGASAVEVEPFDPAEGSPLQPFLSRLFSRQSDAAPSEALAAPVALRSCASPWAQAREAAKACSDAAARGVPLDRIAVAARSLAGGIAEELAAALERVGLPARERRGRPALPAPPIRAALELYDLLERNFPQRALQSLFGSPVLRFLEPADELKAHQVARRLRETRVRDDGRDDGSDPSGGISERLHRLSARLRAKAALKSAAHPGDRAPSEAASGASGQADREAAQVDRVAAVVDRTLAAIRQLPERATAAAHGRALQALLRRAGLGVAAIRAEPPGPPRALSAAVARDTAALEALDQACAGLARAAASLGKAETILTRAEWAELLRDALTDASLTARGARGAAIQLVELRELPGRSFDHLVVVGLLDGELPARPQPDPLLSDEDKRSLNRALGRAVFRTPPPEGPTDSVPLLPPRQAEEPLHLQLALCTAKSALLLWPRADGRGREALRSRFADEAIRALGRGAEKALLAPIPQIAACRSRGDLLARASLEVFADAAWRASPPLPDAQGVALALGVLRPLDAARGSTSLAARLPPLARAAAIERERLKAFSAEVAGGRFSGLLQGAALLAAAPQLRFDDAAPLSASRLETHSTCGFKHFAGRLLGVPDEEDQTDDLQSRERGELIHACLEGFFGRMQREGRLPLRGGPHRDAELATLLEEADAAMVRFAAVQHVGSPSVWKVRQSEIHRKLRRLLDAEASAEGVPRDFEQGFGGKDAPLPPLRILSPDGSASVSIQGRIDRIDAHAGGRELVLDYKAGGVEGLRKKLKLETLCKPEFQLPIYVAAIAQQRPGASVDAAYLSVGSAQRTATLRDAMLKKKGDPDALLELDPARRQLLRERVPPPPNLADAVWERVDQMRAGHFPVAPLSCEFCDLTAICRIVALPAEEDE